MSQPVRSILYRNGVVHSSADPFAEAVLVDDGVVAWIGADDTAAGLAARADRVVDLDGALVTPGFVDAHAHVLETGLAAEAVDLGAAAGVRSLGQALAVLHGRARRLEVADPSGEQVLLAVGWDEQAWPEGRPFTRSELDAACGGRAVYAARVDVHSAVISSAMAARAGIERDPAWTGAAASGSGWSDAPADTGLVTADLHHRVRAVAHTLTPDHRTRLYRDTLAAWAARGVVSVHEMSGEHLDTRAGLAELHALTADPAEHALPHLAAYRGELCRTADDARALLAELPFLTGIGGDLNVDGSIGSRTAALRHPYSDLPADPATAGFTGALTHPDGTPWTGDLYLDADQIAGHLVAVQEAGVQGAFHVIGDRAMDETVLGLQAAAQITSDGAVRSGHHRIEHALFVDAATLAALLVRGVGLSVQPAFDTAFNGSDGVYVTRLGAARAGALMPFADLAQAGVPLAFGSDTPVTPVDPWQAVRAATRHDDPDQRISAGAAFRAHTRGGWRLAGLDHTGAGQLRVGAPAHLAVWRTERLGVQAAPGRLASWSEEARAGTPLLPDLSPDAPEPECLHTLRDGVVIHDTF
ncbi:amidohydrolase [Promicromonospora citrea]|uniref:Amidohydrolase n=1 Tax=Promicromonospora citrea TaxID=43677 RepID=A0A8H9GHF9_9MICO|nr:amidohydrolase family protein [Promicromonospora citrea]NNH54142.1 amidohydrolase family protein [Promicromonospora citrea]GGM28204.1 amidohydrolase [Promicromonospora citrea]